MSAKHYTANLKFWLKMAPFNFGGGNTHIVQCFTCSLQRILIIISTDTTATDSNFNKIVCVSHECSCGILTSNSYKSVFVKEHTGA